MLIFNLELSSEIKVFICPSNDDFLIIYCSGGDCDLSEELGNHLFEYLSYTNILLYEGGFPEWKEKGYPVENE